MSSGKSKRFAASRWTAALVLAGMLILVSGIPAAAQGDAASRLEGAWRAQLTVRDCQTGVALRTFPAIFTFAKGGTVTYTTAGQLPSLFTPGLGVWHHLDNHTYSAVTEVFGFSPAGTFTQTHRLTRLIQLSTDADAFTDTVALQIFAANGDLIATGCATTVASRME